MSGNQDKARVSAHFKTLVVVMVVAGLVGGCTRFQSAETQIEKANAALEKKDNAAAIIHLKNALQKESSSGNARYLLGKTYLLNGQPRDAVKELQRAHDLQFDPNLVLPHLAKAAFFSGELKLLTQLDPQKASDPMARAEILTLQADGLAFEKKVKEAQVQYNEAIKLNPKSLGAHFGLARLAAVAGNFQEAEDLAANISKWAPNDIEIVLFRSDLRKARGEFQAALDFARQATEIDAKDVRPHTMAANLLLALKQNDAALKEVETIKKLAPQSPMGPYLQALMHMQNQKTTEAQQEIQKVLKLAPNHLPSLMLAAKIEIALGNTAQAEQYLKTASDLAPGSVAVRRATALIYLRSGRASAALDLLKPLLERTPEDPELNAMAGEGYFMSGDMEHANKHFAIAAKSDKLARGALTGLAMTNMVSGDIDRAVSELEAATRSQGGGVQAELILIGTLIQQKKFDQALKAIDVLESKTPKSPIPYGLRANVGVAKKDISYTRSMLEKAQQVDPEYFFAVIGLARLDQLENKGAEGVKRLEAYIKKHEKSVGALLTLAETKAQMGAAPDEVIALLKRAQAADPKKIKTSSVLARYQMANGKPKEAMESLQVGLAVSPDSAELVDTQGSINISSGKAVDAVANFTRLTILQPKQAGAWAKLAQAQNMAGDKQAATVSIERALAINPKDFSLIEVAIALRVANKNYNEAVALAQDAQRNYPKSSFGLVQEGDILSAQKKYTEAVDRYDRALKIEPLPSNFVRKHHALELAGKMDEASKALNAWLKLNQKDVMTLTYAGEIELRRKNYDLAVTYYKTALDQQDNNLLALNNLAWLLNEKKDPAALNYVERALKLQPKHPSSLDTRGMIYLRMGKLPEALSDLKAAADYAPNSPAIHLNYARVLLKAGKRDEAKRELEILRRMGGAGSKEVEALAQELG